MWLTGLNAPTNQLIKLYDAEITTKSGGEWGVVVCRFSCHASGVIAMYNFVILPSNQVNVVEYTVVIFTTE